MSDREAIAAVLTALDDTELSFTILAELQFSDGTVNIWLGPKDATISFDSKTWTGTGDLGFIEAIEESEGISDSPLVGVLQATIAQIDTIELAANEGREATFYVLIFNPTTGAIIGAIADPREMGKSWIEPTLENAKGERTITSQIKMEFIAEGTILGRKLVRRLVYADGLEIDSNDHLLEFSSDPDQTRAEQGRNTLRTESGSAGNVARATQSITKLFKVQK